MSATNLYLGINTRNQNFSDSSTIDVASSSTATDYIELRMMTIKADGVTATGLYKARCRQEPQDLRAVH